MSNGFLELVIENNVELGLPILINELTDGALNDYTQNKISEALSTFFSEIAEDIIEDTGDFFHDPSLDKTDDLLEEYNKFRDAYDVIDDILDTLGREDLSADQKYGRALIDAIEKLLPLSGDPSAIADAALALRNKLDEELQRLFDEHPELFEEGLDANGRPILKDDGTVDDTQTSGESSDPINDADNLVSANTPDQSPTGEIVEKVRDDVGLAENKGSPLVLDLGELGIDLTSSAGSDSVYWDIDQDGMAETSGWVGPQDGLLALDANSDGIIKDHSELFGTVDTDGFLILAELDSNEDGTIDANDIAFDDLIVWIDANTDGHSQEEELVSLTDLGIVSIDLNYNVTDYEINGNTVRSESTYTLTDGTERQIVDAWFTYDDVNTTYAQDYTLDIRTLFLPTIRGYGNLPDLHIAMSLDNGEAGLLELVREVAFTDPSTLFSVDFNFEDKIKEILFKWAGVEDVDPASRGNVIDARELAFLEQFTDQPFLQNGSNPNPESDAAEILENAFNDFYNAFVARVLVQTTGESLFTQTANYNLHTDSFEGEFVLNFDAIENVIADLSLLNADIIQSLNNIILLIDHTVGFNNLSSYELSELETMFNDGAGIDFFSNVTFTGTARTDYLNADNANSTLLGLEGDDAVYGATGDDILLGGTGNDNLNGSVGNDSYIWSVGDGNDIINEAGGEDQLILYGVTTDNLRFEMFLDNTLKIHIESEFLTINSQFRANADQVESLLLADGTVIDLVNDVTFTGTAGDENINGTDLDNTLLGLDGNDTLSGKLGDDLLVGGEGNDNLNGGSGNDSYVWSVGDGNDTVYETSGLDQLILQGVTVNDLIFERYDTRHLNINIGSEVIRIQNQFESEFYQIEELHLDDGSVIDLLTYLNTAPDAKDDTFSGDTDTNITGNLLANNGSGMDSDPENNALTVVSGTYSTTNGSVSISSSGDFTYTPNASYTGTDIFTYTIEDGFGGNDTAIVTLVISDPSQNSVNGTSAVDYLYGDQSGVANDILTGFAGNDYLYGQGGNDTYIWSVGDGNDTINETGGVDQIVLHNVLESDIRIEKSGTYDLKINIGSEHITVSSQYMSDYYNSTGYDQYQVETLLLDDGTVIDVLNNLTFVGTTGTDYLYSMNAGATLEGGAGNDSLYGYANSESYIWSVGDGNDTINETGGVDQIVLHNVLESDIRIEKSGTYDLKINIGSEHITVSSQYMSDYYNSTGYDQYQVETLLLDDGTVIDVLNNLTFVGTTGTDYLYSMNAGATLEGGAGNDSLYGYANSESYIWSVGDGNDTINETGGVDQIVLHNVLESDIRLEVSGSYNLKINIGSEYIQVSNQFMSDYYNSTSYDQYQVETLLLDDGTVIDLLNNMTFTGTSGNDYIYGLNASDTLNGLDGSDYLYAGNGDDVLYGGSGIDMLYGQSGADTFVFNDLSSSDNVQDFDLTAGDKLDVSDLLVGYDPLTDAITDFVQITESSGNSYLNVDADGGANNFVQVAYIYNETGLTDEDALETSGNLITV